MLETMIEYIKKYYYIFFVTVACSLGFSSVGGATSWSSSSIIKLAADDSPIYFTSSQLSWVGSFLAIGTLFAVIPYIYAFNSVGRRHLITSIAVFHIIGWIALIFATEVKHVYIGRFILGCAVGPTFGIIPVYISEVVEKSVRGASIGILVMFQSLGAFVQYGAGPVLSFQAHNTISIIIPIAFFILSLGLPETPYYLLKKGKKEKAQTVLMMLRGSSNVKEILNEYSDIENYCAVETPIIGVKDMIKELSLSKTKRIIMIIAVSTFAQQFGGLGAIVVYMESIFISMQIPMYPRTAVIFTEALADATVLVTLVVIDKIGRKPLLLLASLVCMIANALIGLYFFLRVDMVITDEYTWVGLLGVFLVQMGYGMGLGLVPLVVMSEIMSFRLKAWLSGFYLMCQALCNFATIKMFQAIGNDMNSFYSHWIFAGAIMVSVAYLMFYLPETKGNSLHEIQNLLTNVTKSDKDVDREVPYDDFIDIVNIDRMLNDKMYDVKV